jgi:hypothetical protein
LAAPFIIPGSALGKNGAVAPSNRIVIGGIGLGAMGTGNTRAFLSKKEVQYVAICDVDSVRRDKAISMVNGNYKNNDCRSYNHFEEFFEKEKLDAVTIALPDHWHALVSVAAANKGIDIYGEKPLAKINQRGKGNCKCSDKKQSNLANRKLAAISGEFS